ncbi:MAG: hypothetical protein WA003_14760 [Desulfuromonadaceae bacterium]
MRTYSNVHCAIDIETIQGERTLTTQGTLVSTCPFKIKTRIAHYHLADLEERIQRYQALGIGHRGLVLTLTTERDALAAKLVAQAASQVWRRLKGNRHFYDCALTILFCTTIAFYAQQGWWMYLLPVDLLLVAALWLNEHIHARRIRCIEHLIQDAFSGAFVINSSKNKAKEANNARH